MENNVVLEKSIAFALRIIKLYRYLVEEKKEFVMSKEMMVAGTNIGKHINEAVNAESKQIFITGFDVARRKSADTHYLVTAFASWRISYREGIRLDK